MEDHNIICRVVAHSPHGPGFEQKDQTYVQTHGDFGQVGFVTSPEAAAEKYPIGTALLVSIELVPVDVQVEPEPDLFDEGFANGST